MSEENTRRGKERETNGFVSRQVLEYDTFLEVRGQGKIKVTVYQDVLARIRGFWLLFSHQIP